jgi:hypothetical protein
VYRVQAPQLVVAKHYNMGLGLRDQGTGRLHPEWRGLDVSSSGALNQIRSKVTLIH